MAWFGNLAVTCKGAKPGGGYPLPVLLGCLLHLCRGRGQERGDVVAPSPCILALPMARRGQKGARLAGRLSYELARACGCSEMTICHPLDGSHFIVCALEERPPPFSFSCPPPRRLLSHERRGKGRLAAAAAAAIGKLPLSGCPRPVGAGRAFIPESSAVQQVSACRSELSAGWGKVGAGGGGLRSFNLACPSTEPVYFTQLRRPVRVGVGVGGGMYYKAANPRGRQAPSAGDAEDEVTAGKWSASLCVTRLRTLS